MKRFNYRVRSHHKVVGNLDTPLKELEENIMRLSEKLNLKNVHQVADGIH